MNFVMIFPFVGVLFTQDPLTQSPAVMTINANYGLGEVSCTQLEMSVLGFKKIGDSAIEIYLSTAVAAIIIIGKLLVT